jgi:hypothetical protein
MRYAHLAPVTLFAAVKALDKWNEGDTEAERLTDLASSGEDC